MAEAKRRFVRRWRLFVDPKVQGSLLVRVLGYWVSCVMLISTTVFIWTAVLSGPEQLPQRFKELWIYGASSVFASVLILPGVMYDLISLSNRFCGPLVRIRAAMQQLANGEPVTPVTFRKGDFWQDLCENFNTLAARVQKSQDGSWTETESGVSREPVEVG